MGVIFQAWFRRASNETVPSPYDKATPDIPWWWDKLASEANMLRQVGFTAFLLPPVLKTSAGAFPGADGYGCFDDYDAGSKNQFYSVATRYGDRQSLQRLVATCRANGIDVYIDNVMHQRIGGAGNCNYEYLGANGVPGKGAFPKSASCFVGEPPRVPRDPIAGPVSDDFGFGDELAPLNGTFNGEKRYVLNQLIQAGDWLTRSLDVQGYRLDDVKGLAVEAVLGWLNSSAMRGKIGVGEYFDGNPQTLKWWVWESGMMGRCYAFDFSIHFLVQAMCNSGSHFDMTQLDHAGLAGISPGQSVTFVENPDTDTNGFATVIWNKVLGYAYILTTEGYPSVYYRDYSTDRDCYGLKPWIDTLVWIHEHLANGETIFRHKEYQFVVYERTGYPNLLVGLNNDTYDGWKQVTVQTGFGANVHLHDYAGHASDQWTDGNGNVTIWIPPNDNGQGYVCYSRFGLDAPNPVNFWPCSQEFFGRADLDLGPVPAGGSLNVWPKIWINSGHPVKLEHSSPADADLTFQLVDPQNRTLDFDENGLIHPHEHSSGWYTLRVTNKTAADLHWNVKLTYFGTQTLKAADISPVGAVKHLASDDPASERVTSQTDKACEERLRRRAR